jgi:hypothetical protein
MLTGFLKEATVNQYVNNEALSFINVYGEIPETLVFYIGMDNKKTSKVLVSKQLSVLTIKKQ